jgi:hypothetical protein
MYVRPSFSCEHKERTKWAGHVACVRKLRIVYRIKLQTLEVRDYLGYQIVEESLILNLTLTLPHWHVVWNQLVQDRVIL